MPVVPLIRVKNIDEAIDLAYELEKNCFHTAAIHSKNIDHMHRMAVKMNCSIFVKNGPALAGLAMGGEGQQLLPSPLQLVKGTQRLVTLLEQGDAFYRGILELPDKTLD